MDVEGSDIDLFTTYMETLEIRNMRLWKPGGKSAQDAILSAVEIAENSVLSKLSR